MRVLRLRTHRLKRFKAIRKLRPLFKRIVILTGTQAPNTLLDIWAQMYH